MVNYDTKVTTLFTYNEKGLLKNLDNGLTNYEITYNSSDLPVKIVAYPGESYSLEWGTNQFIVSSTSSGYSYQYTCYTVSENKIKNTILKTKKIDDGKILVSYEDCTWFGDDSLSVTVTSPDNEKRIHRYKFIPENHIFKNINLAILMLTSTNFLGPTYQNRWLESDYTADGITISVYHYDWGIINPTRADIVYHPIYKLMESVFFEYESY
jgi:hypothetical protein